LGALSFEHDEASVVITRLGVHPTHLRQGIATALLSDLERHLPPITQLTVSTAQANTPGIHFYMRRSYGVAGRSVSPEGIPILHLSKCVDG
jgi:ribosomal protein S18 acetylase RimI-like enzyme